MCSRHAAAPIRPTPASDPPRRAASAISESLRSSDISARIGGDEFAVVLFGIDDDDVHTAIEQITTAVTEDNRDTVTGSGLSISLGAATSVGDESIDDLIARGWPNGSFSSSS